MPVQPQRCDALPPPPRRASPALPVPCHGAGAQSCHHGNKGREGGILGSHLASPQHPSGWRMVAFRVAGRAGGGLNGACEPSLGGHPALISPAPLPPSSQRQGWHQPSSSPGPPCCHPRWCPLRLSPCPGTCTHMPGGGGKMQCGVEATPVESTAGAGALWGDIGEGLWRE